MRGEAERESDFIEGGFMFNSEEECEVSIFDSRGDAFFIDEFREDAEGFFFIISEERDMSSFNEVWYFKDSGDMNSDIVSIRA